MNKLFEFILRNSLFWGYILSFDLLTGKGMIALIYFYKALLFTYIFNPWSLMTF